MLVVGVIADVTCALEDTGVLPPARRVQHSIDFSFGVGMEHYRLGDSVG